MPSFLGTPSCHSTSFYPRFARFPPGILILNRYNCTLFENGLFDLYAGTLWPPCLYCVLVLQRKYFINKNYGLIKHLHLIPTSSSPPSSGLKTSSTVSSTSPPAHSPAPSFPSTPQSPHRSRTGLGAGILA